MVDANGNRLYSFSQISNEAISYFQNLIGTKDARVVGCTQDFLEEIIKIVLPEDAATVLSQPITPEEIRSSMFSINGDKAPGPDGYTACFFKTAWSVVGEDVIRAILFYFQTCKMLPAFNSTGVALVPKCQNPSSMKDFRPISCCSIIYKCITKIMAFRLQKYMPSLISPNQSAFVKGRSITDNVLLAHELV